MGTIAFFVYVCKKQFLVMIHPRVSLSARLVSAFLKVCGSRYGIISRPQKSSKRRFFSQDAYR